MPGKYEPGDYDLRVSRSQTGLGLFTDSAIPKGKCVIEYWGKTLTREEELTSRSKYLFEISARKTIDGAPRWNTKSTRPLDVTGSQITAMLPEAGDRYGVSRFHVIVNEELRK